MDYKSWYKKNYTPEQIKEIQGTLGVTEDGIVGKNTIAAIKEYQDNAGVTSDGLWGKSTQAKADEWNTEYDRLAKQLSAKAKEQAKSPVVEVVEDTQYSNTLPNYEISNAELALINKEIDKVKKQLAERQSNYESVPQPKTKVGWASYIVNNDRGMLDKYQEAERAWYNKMVDQEHTKELAKAQRQEQEEINLNDARDSLAKLQLVKEDLTNRGGDTREVDLQIAAIYRDYPDLSVTDIPKEEYDQRSSVEYVLADVEDIDANNTQEEIKAAIEKVSKFKTPESVKALNRLDKALSSRIKIEGNKAKYDAELDSWVKTGVTSNYLHNLGYEVEFAGEDKERLVTKTGNIIRERKKVKKSPASNSTDSNSTTAEPW